MKLAEVPVIGLILEAGLLVQIVMAILLLASVVSWVVMIKKRRMVRRAANEATDFETRFWSGVDLATLYDSQTGRKQGVQGLEAVFGAGFREFMKLRQQSSMSRADIMQGVRRQMRVQLTREVDDLEDELSILATIGSVSPYVGLFGTVWGIMNSFIGLKDAKNTTIDAVAPGIAEALVATAMGLFAAIPAVVSYNSLINNITRLEIRYETFVEEFLGILQRHADSLE